MDNALIPKKDRIVVGQKKNHSEMSEYLTPAFEQSLIIFTPLELWILEATLGIFIYNKWFYSTKSLLELLIGNSLTCVEGRKESEGEKGGMK